MKLTRPLWILLALTVAGCGDEGLMVPEDNPCVACARAADSANPEGVSFDADAPATVLVMCPNNSTEISLSPCDEMLGPIALDQIRDALEICGSFVPDACC